MMAPGPLDSCSAGIALLADPRVEVALLDTGGRDVLRHGLPVDRYDVLVLGDALPPGEAAEAPAWQQLAGWLAPGCTQCVLAASDQPLWNALGSRLAGRPVHRRPGAELAQALASLLSNGKSC